MALTNGQIVGTLFGGVAKVFLQGTIPYLFQVGVNGELIPRGGGITQDQSVFIRDSAVTSADFLTIKTSDAYGTAAPDGVLAPAGYVIKSLSNGAIVFVLAGDADDYVDPTITADLANITRAANLTENPIEWAKENPLYAAVGAVAIYMVAVYLFAGTKAKRKKLSFGILS
jgi:hypothetical protein